MSTPDDPSSVKWSAKQIRSDEAAREKERPGEGQAVVRNRQGGEPDGNDSRRGSVHDDRSLLSRDNDLSMNGYEQSDGPSDSPSESPRSNATGTPRSPSRLAAMKAQMEQLKGSMRNTASSSTSPVKHASADVTLTWPASNPPGATDQDKTH